MPNVKTVSPMQVSKSCVPKQVDLHRLSHLHGINIPELKDSNVITGRKDGFAINLQLCKFVANLTFKFASTLQWSFYYLCDTKFAIHTLMPLHLRKFMGSNLEQICNGCFIIFTMPNLQYILCNLQYIICNNVTCKCG